MVHTFKGLVLIIESNKLMYEIKDVDVTDTAVSTLIMHKIFITYIRTHHPSLQLLT